MKPRYPIYFKNEMLQDQSNEIKVIEECNETFAMLMPVTNNPKIKKLHRITESNVETISNEGTPTFDFKSFSSPHDSHLKKCSSPTNIASRN